MISDLYMWMIRRRGRGKNPTPGPWQPRSLTEPVSLERLQTMQNCVKKWNQTDKKNEHAIFLILGGMLQEERQEDQ